MEHHLEAVAARISQLKAQDLPSALQGLLKQAETALRPASKSDKWKNSATPAAQRRSLVSALLLLLERASALDHGSAAYQAVRAQLLAAFQQHAWLWERLIRVDMAEVLNTPAAASTLTEVLLLLSGPTQARALNLLRLNLPHQQPPSPAQQAVQQAILARILLQLQQCFPVVSYALPGGFSPAGPSSQRPTQDGSSGSRVQVRLREQLPALLHLALHLVCREGGSGSAGVGSGSDNSTAALQSASASNGSSSVFASGGTAAAPGPSHTTAPAHRGEPDGTDGAGMAAASRDAVLRYAALLLQRLSQPDSLHEVLGLTLHHGPPAGPEARGMGVGEGEVARMRSAQQTMEVLLDALLTMPCVAAETSRQLHSSVISNPGPAQGPPAAAAAQQRGSGLQREGCGAGEEALQEAGPTVAALLALHWELTKLLAACLAEPEGKGARWNGVHLSRDCCLQLLRLSASKQHLAGAAVQRLLASMPRAGTNHTNPLPPVQLLLPPAVMSHLLDLISKALQGGVGQRGPKGGPSYSLAASLASEEARWLRELSERVLEIQQACFQGLSQPWLVLRGMLHREAISAASRLHSLLTQPPAATAEAIHAAATAAAAAAACDMGAEGVLEEGGGAGAGAGARRHSTARKRCLPCLSEAALTGSRQQPSAKRSRMAAPAGVGAPAGLPGARPAHEGREGGARSGDSAAVAEPASALEALLQLLQVQPAEPTADDTHNPQEGGGACSQPPPETCVADSARGPAEGAPAKTAPAGRWRIAAHPLMQPAQQAQRDSSAEQAAQQSKAAAAKKRITPVMVTEADAGKGGALLPTPGPLGQAMPQPGPIVATIASAAAVATSTGVCGSREGAGGTAGAAGPGAGADGVRDLAQQTKGGRVHLTAVGDLDDEGREALWTAYIADKDFMVEMLGDTEYCQQYDEDNPLLPAHTATLKGVDAVLDAALGRPVEDDVIDDSDDESVAAHLALLPPGPQTLLAASVQLPWQAALAACLLLLKRCLDRVLEGVGPAHSQGGQGGDAGGPPEAEAAARLLCGGALGEKQRRAAALAALHVDEPHCGATTATLAMKGACSHRMGGALLHFAAQLHEAVELRTGGRTAPVLLSSYAALLPHLLALAQQEEAFLREAHAGGKKLGRPPLQLLPPVGLHLLGSKRLRPAAVSPDSVGCLLQLAGPHREQQQEALVHHAAMLWVLLQPPGHLSVAAASTKRSTHGKHSRRSAPPPPSWLHCAPSDLSKHLLLLQGAPPAARVAAAEELLCLLGEGVERWAQQGGGKEGLAQALGQALVPPAPRLAAAAEITLLETASGAPQAVARKQRGKGRGRGRGRPKKVAPAAAAADADESAASAAGAAAVSGSVPSAGAAASGQQGGLTVEALLPVIDVCCTAVQWLELQQQDEAEGAQGTAAPRPLLSPLALRRLLLLCQRLAAICAGVLELLAAYMDGATGADTCPPGLAQAAVLWAVSLEMGQCMAAVDEIPWPQALQPHHQQLCAALEQLAGVQQACAELLRCVPEVHPAYHTILVAMDDAPSLFLFVQPGEGEGGLAGPSHGPGQDGQSDTDGASSSEGEGGGGGKRRERGKQAGDRGGRKGVGVKGGMMQQAAAQRGQRRRRRRLRDIKNPYLRAIIAEGGLHADDLDGDDLSDLEDFIVANPERNYAQFVAEHFPLAQDSDGDDDDDDDEVDDAEGEGGEPVMQAEQQAGQPAGCTGGRRGREQGRGRRQRRPVSATAGERGGTRGGQGGSSRQAMGRAQGRAVAGPARQQQPPQQQQQQQQQHDGQEPNQAAVGGGTWARLQQLMPELRSAQGQGQPAAAVGRTRATRGRGGLG